MRRHLFTILSIHFIILVNKISLSSSAPDGKQQSDRSVADTQTQCLSGEQGVLCQAQALAALVDENGKLQSSHSQSQAAGAASGSTWDNGDNEPDKGDDDEPKEVEGAGDLD